MRNTRHSTKPRILTIALLMCLGPLPAGALGTVEQEGPGAEAAPAGMAEVQELAADFFDWRRTQQPVSGDDIPRVERPDGWVPDFSPAALDSYRRQYREYLRTVDALDTGGWAVAAHVDARLLRAAIQRVHWELEVLEAPRRDPSFYVQQTLGSVFELLIISSPMDDARARNMVLRLEGIPATLEAARANLDRPVRPFAEAAIESLAGIDDRLQRMEDALAETFPPALRERLGAAVTKAADALQAYAAWLESGLDSMQTAFAPGPVSYQWFLTNVALIPLSTGELLAQGRQARNRAVAWETLQQHRNRDLPPLDLFKTAERQISSALVNEREIRAFLGSRDLMTVPDWHRKRDSMRTPAATSASRPRICPTSRCRQPGTRAR